MRDCFTRKLKVPQVLLIDRTCPAISVCPRIIANGKFPLTKVRIRTSSTANLIVQEGIIITRKEKKKEETLCASRNETITRISLLYRRRHRFAPPPSLSLSLSLARSLARARLSSTCAISSAILASHTVTAHAHTRLNYRLAFSRTQPLAYAVCTRHTLSLVHF